MIRFDNGHPWAHPQSRVPTPLTLWLVGLGISPLFGRPRQSTDNAVVERSHGVLANWVEPQTCANEAELQARLHKFAHIQRAQYPACDGKSRLATYPQLEHNPRVYVIADDETLWDIKRVWNYVAQFRFTRLVEKIGRITVMMREYSVGRAYRAQHVTVYLQETTGEWVVEDKWGTVIKTFPATQLCYSLIANLALVYRGKI